MKPLPLVRPDEHPLCPYCGRKHVAETQDICNIIKLAARSDAALDRILTRP
jgi:hypothetical protein